MIGVEGLAAETAATLLTGVDSTFDVSKVSAQAMHNGVPIGTPASTSFDGASAVVTTGVAAYDAAAWIVPYLKAKALIWLDASDAANFVFKDKTFGYVTKWNDLSSYGRTATSYMANYGSLGVADGVPAYLMGAVGAQIDMNFTRMTGIRTVFEAMAIRSSSGGFNQWLGDDTACHFHRNTDGSYDSQWGMQNCSFYKDGELVAAPRTTVPPSDRHVYTIVTSAGANANQLSRDRKTNARSSGRDLSELIVFDVVLSDVDRQAIEAYLAAKWMGESPTAAAAANTYTVRGELDVDDTISGAVNLSFADGASIVVANPPAEGAMVTTTGSVTILSGASDVTLKGSANFQGNRYIDRMQGAMVGKLTVENTGANDLRATSAFAGGLTLAPGVSAQVAKYGETNYAYAVSVNDPAMIGYIAGNGWSYPYASADFFNYAYKKFSTSPIAAKTTSVGRGEFYVPADKAGDWTFSVCYDDRSLLKIDGVQVCRSDAWNAPASNTANLSAGWHRWEVRVGEGAGGGWGPDSGQNGGDTVRFIAPGESAYKRFDENNLKLAATLGDIAVLEPAGIYKDLNLGAGATLTSSGTMPMSIYGTLKGTGSLAGSWEFAGTTNCWEVTNAVAKTAELPAATFAAATPATFAGLKSVKVTFNAKPSRRAYYLTGVVAGLTEAPAATVIATDGENDFSANFTLTVKNGRLAIGNSKPAGIFILVR